MVVDDEGEGEGEEEEEEEEEEGEEEEEEEEEEDDPSTGNASSATVLARSVAPSFHSSGGSYSALQPPDASPLLLLSIASTVRW